jgi:hypothetical protein
VLGVFLRSDHCGDPPLPSLADICAWVWGLEAILPIKTNLRDAFLRIFTTAELRTGTPSARQKYTAVLAYSYSGMREQLT